MSEIEKLKDGIRTAIDLLLAYQDRYLDFEVPENTTAPGVLREIQDIRSHLMGTLLGADYDDQT